MCDLTITRLAEDRFWVVTGGAVGRHDVAWMRRHVPADGSVVLTDLTSSLCCLGVWGPQARELVGSRTEDDLSNEALPYMRAGTAAHRPCRRAARCACPTSASWGGRSTRRRSSGARLWDTLWDGRAAAGRRRVRRRRLRLAAPGEGLPAVGPGHRRGARPLRGRPGLGRAAGQGRGLHRPRRGGRGRQGARRDAAAVLPGHRRPRGHARRQGAAARRRRARSATSRARATARRSARASSTATCRSSCAEPGTVLAVHSAGADHRVTVVSEPRFDPEMARLRDVAAAAR